MTESIYGIAVQVAERYRLPVMRVLARSRVEREAAARLTIYRIAADAGYSYAAIGRRLGRCRSTVRYGVLAARRLGL
ncbi:MAG: helix-turn-helix domain-containing protein [Pseudomonadota bacterium]